MIDLHRLKRNFNEKIWYAKMNFFLVIPPEAIGVL